MVCLEKCTFCASFYYYYCSKLAPPGNKSQMEYVVLLLFSHTLFTTAGRQAGLLTYFLKELFSASHPTILMLCWKKSQKVGQQFLCCQEDRGTIRPRHCCCCCFCQEVVLCRTSLYTATTSRRPPPPPRCGIQGLLKNSFRLDFEAFKTNVIRRLFHY